MHCHSTIRGNHESWLRFIGGTVLPPNSIIGKDSLIGSVHFLLPGTSVFVMFHVKICGVRRAEDVQAVESSLADAVGFNFFPRSVRYVDPEALETAALSQLAASAGLVRVGVFVNASPHEIATVAKRIGLEAIQLHGDEDIALATRVKREVGLPVIRAIKLPPERLERGEIADQTEAWIEAGFRLLLDADAGAEHGGSGKTIDWEAVREWSQATRTVDWTLAGGLNRDNIAEAIELSGAVSVDTASGVEQTRGEKSFQLIHDFAARAMKAMRAIPPK
jgi:phosphoribosylanthranilate isomerase